MAGSLFERLTCGTASEKATDDESIRAHLLRMFVARQGSVQTLPDYGLPDLNDLTLSRAELIKETCAGIRDCITRYEPRLTGVHVAHMPLPDSTFTMGFRIRAQKYDESGNLQPWQWDVFLDGDKFKDRA